MNIIIVALSYPHFVMQVSVIAHMREEGQLNVEWARLQTSVGYKGSL